MLLIVTCVIRKFCPPPKKMTVLPSGTLSDDAAITRIRVVLTMMWLNVHVGAVVADGDEQRFRLEAGDLSRNVERRVPVWRRLPAGRRLDAARSARTCLVIDGRQHQSGALRRQLRVNAEADRAKLAAADVHVVFVVVVVVVVVVAFGVVVVRPHRCAKHRPKMPSSKICRLLLHIAWSACLSVGHDRE